MKGFANLVILNTIYKCKNIKWTCIKKETKLNPNIINRSIKFLQKNDYVKKKDDIYIITDNGIGFLQKTSEKMVKAAAGTYMELYKIYEGFKK